TLHHLLTNTSGIPDYVTTEGFTRIMGTPRPDAAVLAGAPGALLTASTALAGDCQAATGALNIALAALAVRDGVAPALIGLADPRTGDLAAYVTKPGLGPVERALALTAAPGSVRGAVLLGAM
ncbi:hypothetical protein AB0H81_26715, partial [Nonomuraea sp. NPDC050691]